MLYREVTVPKSEIYPESQKSRHSWRLSSRGRPYPLAFASGRSVCTKAAALHEVLLLGCSQITGASALKNILIQVTHHLLERAEILSSQMSMAMMLSKTLRPAARFARSEISLRFFSTPVVDIGQPVIDIPHIDINAPVVQKRTKHKVPQKR